MNGGAFSLLTLRTALSNLYKNTNIIIAMAFILIIAVIIIPIRPLVLDLLLVFNITLALVIILVTLFVTEVLQLATFPSVLLVATLFRLALNISSTRLILTEARAGEVINAFGQFVVGGNYVVGLIILLSLRWCSLWLLPAVRAHRRGRCAFYAGCHARQADEHRC